MLGLMYRGIPILASLRSMTRPLSSSFKSTSTMRNPNQGSSRVWLINFDIVTLVERDQPIRRRGQSSELLISRSQGQPRWLAPALGRFATTLLLPGALPIE
jgi:hypothetical protein